MSYVWLALIAVDVDSWRSSVVQDAEVVDTSVAKARSREWLVLVCGC